MWLLGGLLFLLVLLLILGFYWSRRSCGKPSGNPCNAPLCINGASAEGILRRVQSAVTAAGAAGGAGAAGLAGLGGLQGPAGPPGIQGPAGAPGAALGFASFFGMTAGPGNTTPTTDYPATIAASAAGPSVAGLSAINFPRSSGASSGGIVINNPGAAQTNNTEFLLPAAGTYRVSWHISVDEATQFSLWKSTAASPAPGGQFVQFLTALGSPSTTGQNTGTNIFNGDVIVDVPVANTVIQVRNYAATGGAVTVTPLPGGTQAQAVVLIIQRLL